MTLATVRRNAKLSDNCMQAAVNFVTPQSQRRTAARMDIVPNLPAYLGTNTLDFRSKTRATFDMELAYGDVWR